MKKIKIIVLILISTQFFTMINSDVVGQNNDRVEKRENYVLRFVNSGPDLQFYLRIDENDTNSRFRYTLKWSNLIEYTDIDNDGIYNKSVDTKISTVDLTKLFFQLREIWGEADGVNSTIVEGKQFNFTADFSQGSVNGKFGIGVDWWDGDVKIPYAGDILEVAKEESKFTVAIDNWKFQSQENRLALKVDIITTTPIENYAIVNLNNGTFGMLTKDNEDGKGHRGGIINNPSKVEIDNNIGETKISVMNNGDNLELQYNFPAFIESLTYDPTYAAVATPKLPPEFNSNEDTSNTTKIQGVPGFEIGIFIIAMIGIVLILKSSFKRKLD